MPLKFRNDAYGAGAPVTHMDDRDKHFNPGACFHYMDGFMFYTGLAICFIAIIMQLRIGMWRYKKYHEVKGIPLKLDELKAEYRNRRWKILLLQIAGIIIAIIGLNI